MNGDHHSRTHRSAAAVTMAAALLLFAFGLFPLANVITSGAALPWYRHALTFWILVGGSVLLVLGVLGVARQAALEQTWTRVVDVILHIPWPVFVAACAMMSFALSAFIAVYCFGRQPHSADEVAQLFHAKILLGGRLTLPADPDAAFFQMDDVIANTRWYSQFPIGGPLLLALGELVNAAWLLNPVLLALTLVSTAAFARRAYGDGFARCVALLFALCPFALFMGASFMNHVATAWLVSIAVWQGAEWCGAATQRERTIAAVVIGASLGSAFTVRPLDALAAAAVIGVLQLSTLRDAPSRARSLALQAATGMLPVAALLVVNARTNGSATTLGYEILYGTSHQLGFHVDPYGTPHTPLRAVLFASKYLLQLNVLLFEWPLPALGVIIAGLLAIRRPSRWDLLATGMLLAQTAAYALYWHDGAFRGPRFLFTALPLLIVLVVRAPFALAERTRGMPRFVVTCALPACASIAWLAYGINDSVPGRMRQYRSAAVVTRTNPGDVVRAARVHHALVFVNEGAEGRNLHLLVSLGMRRADAARLVVSASSCAVRQSIDLEARFVPPTTSGRRDRLIRGALVVDPHAPEPASCVADEQRDALGTAPYVTFFAANEIDRDGHIAGDVIWVLDLGERNEELRARFGDRRWYRLTGTASGRGVPALQPY